jgi:16S rRNA processing protein RimM
MTLDVSGPGSKANEPVAIGIVRKPHGVHGQCCVSGFGDTLSQIRTPARLLLGIDEQSAKEVLVTELRQNPKGFICRFAGYDDMNAAETLRDHMLFCDSNDLPALDKGRHYGFELLGLTVVAEEDGAVLGTVTEVESFPTVDSLEVRRENGTMISIAMTPGAILSVNKGEGTITVARAAIDEIRA